MILSEAVAAVEVTLDSPRLRVDRATPREDDDSFLLVVLDAGAGGPADGDRPVANGPRLVAKSDGTVTRLSVPDALARALRMRIASVR